MVKTAGVADAKAIMEKTNPTAKSLRLPCMQACLKQAMPFTASTTTKAISKANIGKSKSASSWSVH